jgi:hypothetical protein
MSTDIQRLIQHLRCYPADPDKIIKIAKKWEDRIQKILGPVHVSWQVYYDLARVDVAREEMSRESDHPVHA